MSSINLPKAVLQSSPADLSDSLQESPMATVRSQAKLQELLKANLTQAIQEVHQTRIKNLRKELDYLKETEWKYEPIEKYIGQNH